MFDPMEQVLSLWAGAVPIKPLPTKEVHNVPWFEVDVLELGHRVSYALMDESEVSLLYLLNFERNPEDGGR